MSNVQLGEREAVRVFLEVGTKRILGMTPASIMAPLTTNIQFTSEVLHHAWEIERYLAKWREQAKFEAVARTERQAQRDAIFRNALASQIRALPVNQYNRDMNNAALKQMDARYDAELNRQQNPVLHGMAEAYDAKATAADVAQDGAYYKNPDAGISHVGGGAVDMKGAVAAIHETIRNSNLGGGR
jgi:hypothetical protein